MDVWSPSVSVLDILPTRLSSVYTYYNPDFRHMEWGTYTALREIFWAQQVYRSASPALAWYDMNFYVHQCSRMSYKRHFKPSEILCSKSLRWVLLDASLAKLDADKYAVLADVTPDELERQTATRVAQETAAVDNVLLEVNKGESYYVSGELSVASKSTIHSYLRAFVGMVGPRLASRMIVDPSVMLVSVDRLNPALLVSQCPLVFGIVSISPLKINVQLSTQQQRLE
jgi:Arginine-tRNA-protein transferase, C terminus